MIAVLTSTCEAVGLSFFSGSVSMGSIGELLFFCLFVFCQLVSFRGVIFIRQGVVSVRVVGVYLGFFA